MNTIEKMPARSWILQTENINKKYNTIPMRWIRRETRGGAFEANAPAKIFKALHSNFDIYKNFQRMKMKFYILIIFKKLYWNFSLRCSLIIIYLQDLSWDRLSDRKFREWLAFNHKYAGSVNLGDSLNCSYF